MTKSIYTLVPDIQELLRRKDGWFTDEIADEFAKVTAKSLQQQFGLKTDKPTLRLSQMGPRCPCALWNSIHHPELAEKLPPWAENKYAFGHIVEAWALALCKAAGHSVQGEQEELYVDGIRGHRDAVVDGCTLDVKSSSSYGIKKFMDGSIQEDDPFGYLEQLDGYICASLSDPIVTVKDRGFLLVIDKQLGHMVLYEHKFREDHIRRRIKQYRDIIAQPTAPKCECGTKLFGKAGNIGLDTKASYNVYKHCCFPNLRTFIYADGPVYLTEVVKRPDPKIIEVDKFGRRVS